MSQNDEDPLFRALEQVLLGGMPPPMTTPTDIGNTALSPAILTTEFVLKCPEGNELFKKWLHDTKTFPVAIEGVELPEDALERDLKVAVNGILVVEQAAQYVQEQTNRVEDDAQRPSDLRSPQG